MKTEGIYTAGDPAQLERPTWSALTTRHASFALGNGLARRYPPDISPMSAVREVSEGSLQDLAALLAPGDIVGLFSAEPVAATRDLTVMFHKFVDQMIYEGSETAPTASVVAELTPADVPEMMHLVELTKPGPFAVRTIALGSYIGIRDGVSWSPWRGSGCGSMALQKSQGCVRIRITVGAGIRPCLSALSCDKSWIAATHRFCISSTITRGLPRSTGSLASRHDVLLQ